MMYLSSSSNRDKNKQDKSPLLILGIIALFSVGVYLVFSTVFYRVGFPLDDAWIHQTYAKNLALHGKWEFLLGQTSGGSTAPLWTVLLVPGYWLDLAPYVWSDLLGLILLFVLGCVVEINFRKMVSEYNPKIPWVGGLIILEWHMAWSAVSGMETLLFALLATSVLIILIVTPEKGALLGILIGLSIWVRPDGVSLLGPAIIVLIIRGCSRGFHPRLFLDFLLAFGVLFAAYLVFNLLIAGSPWPNTFYAKQAEYAILVETPFLSRIAKIFLQPLVGAGSILLPGFLYYIINSFQKKNWGVLVISIWIIGYLLMFAVRLPVVYQHGRYMMPTIPIIILFGMAGMIDWVSKKVGKWKELITIVWKLSLFFIVIAFFLFGAYTFAVDVAFIETEMVATAQWISHNIPPGTLLAAHDIGALGYYCDHELIDMAGLMSPEVIPFIRDETRLGIFLSDKGVDYLVTFPSWYPNLILEQSVVFSSSGFVAPLLGSDNMSVFNWSH